MEANKVRSNSDITWRDVQIQQRKFSQLICVFHHPRSRLVRSSLSFSFQMPHESYMSLFSPLAGVLSLWLLIISIFAGKQLELSVILTLHFVLRFVFVAMIIFFSNLLMIVDVAFMVELLAPQTSLMVSDHIALTTAKSLGESLVPCHNVDLTMISFNHGKFYIPSSSPRKAWKFIESPKIIY
jgi:hypothetical protein